MVPSIHESSAKKTNIVCISYRALRAEYTSVCCSDIASYKASYKSFTSKNLDEGVHCFLRPNTLASRACVLLRHKMFMKKNVGALRGMMTSRESLKWSTRRGTID
jgi:hypothetical protein